MAQYHKIHLRVAVPNDPENDRFRLLKEFAKQVKQGAFPGVELDFGAVGTRAGTHEGEKSFVVAVKMQTEGEYGKEVLEALFK